MGGNPLTFIQSRMHVCCDCSNTIFMDIYLNYVHTFFWPIIFVSVCVSVKISFSNTKSTDLKLQFYSGLNGES